MREQKNQISDSQVKEHHLPWDFISLPFLGAVLIYCALIFYLSSMSSFPVPSPFSFFDKVAHFFLFAGLSTLVALCLRQARRQSSSKMLLFIPASFSVLYGLSDEIHQLAVPFRDFSAGDIAADAIGAVAAAGIFIYARRWRKPRR